MGYVFKRSKYNNQITKVDNISFDSKKEAERYKVLKLAEKSKLIKELSVHPKFVMPMGFSYEADFKYWSIPYSKWIVEDIKGFETAVFKLKYKCFKYFYPDKEIRIIK